MLNRRLVAASLFSLFVLPLGVSAQHPASAPSAELAGIAHVAIRVHDLDASVAYYEKLGFVKAFALSREGKVYEAFIKIDDQQYLELYPVDEKNPQAGFLHVCFYGKDLQSVHDYYVAHGLTPKDVRTAGAGNLLFTMPGPATSTGPQNMEYTQYMPGSMHSKAVGQSLGPNRISTHLSGVEIAFVNPNEAAAFYADKVGFVSLKKGGRMHRMDLPVFALPGNPTEKITMVSAAELGLRARIHLEAAPGATETLKERGVEFRQGGALGEKSVLLTDPDGNQLILDGR